MASYVRLTKEQVAVLRSNYGTERYPPGTIFRLAELSDQDLFQVTWALHPKVGSRFRRFDDEFEELDPLEEAVREVLTDG